MPIIDTNTSRSISSLLRAQQTGFRDAVNEQGRLVRNTATTGLKARLVALVQQGTFTPGSLAGRIIKVLVGRQSFKSISQQLQANADSSVRHVITAFTQTETKGLDKDMKTMVANKIEKRLGSRRSGFSAREFASLHNAIKEKYVPERLAARQSLISTVAGGNPTPKMQALDQSDLRIAIEALSTRRSTGEVMRQHKRTAFRGAVHQDKVHQLTKELAALEDTFKFSPEINKLQNKVRQLEGVAAAQPETLEQLAELQSELAQRKDQAGARAETFRENYIGTLAGLYEEASAGEDSLTLPDSKYREDQAQGTGLPGRLEVPDLHHSPDDPEQVQAREQGRKKTVSFDKAYTREDPVAAGPDQTQLWEFAESKDMLTIEQVETALAQADMDNLQDPLLSRLEKKVSKSLNDIIKRQGMNPDISARVKTAREHPLCNPEARFTGSRYHDLDDIQDMLTIMDADAPLVSDKKLALEMYESMLRAEQSRLTNTEEKTTIAELKQHPVFEKHVLNYIEERVSDTETTLRGRSREKTLYVLNSVTNDASASDADRTRAQALLDRLQASRPQSPV